MRSQFHLRNSLLAVVLFLIILNTSVQADPEGIVGAPVQSHITPAVRDLPRHKLKGAAAPVDLPPQQTYGKINLNRSEGGLDPLLQVQA